MSSHKSNSKSKCSNDNTTMLLVVGAVLLVILYVLYNKNNTSNEGFAENLEPIGNEVKLVLFHATWCGHCQKFKPEWAKAENALKKMGNNVNGKSIRMVKVDADEQPDLVKKYNVSGFPTVKVMTQGKIMDYEGDRSMSGLMKYVKNMTA